MTPWASGMPSWTPAARAASARSARRRSTSRASRRDSSAPKVDFVSAEHTTRVGRERSPLELGLEWLVDFDKGHFNGRRALLAERARGPRRRLVGLDIDGNKPAHNALLYAEKAGKREVGSVTSATWSPTCKRNIALAMVDAPYFSMGGTVWADIYLNRELVWERRMCRARIVERPFFAPDRRHARRLPSERLRDGHAYLRSRLALRRSSACRQRRDCRSRSPTPTGPGSTPSQAADRHRGGQQELRRLHRRREHQPAHLQGRDVRAGGRLGLRQDDVAAHAGRLRGAERRTHHHRGCGHEPACRRTSGRST